jgi:PKHD-type hydroxylase
MRNTWQMWSAGISEETIKEIEQQTESVPQQEATVFAGAKSIPDVRRSNIKWLTGNSFVLNILWAYVQEANRNAFNVDVCQVADIQYTEYHASEKGHYGLHHDINWESTKAFDRKLSVTVQLSSPNDYEGGNFSFTEVETPPKQSRAKGTVLIFPSYLQHQVTPVTKGVRKSLVAWFEGPRWR